MPRLSLGLGVQNAKKVKFGGSAPGPTLPLSTVTLTTNIPYLGIITPYLRQDNTHWLANYSEIDGNYYWLTFGYWQTTPNAWEVWFDDGGGTSLISTNLASSSAIPLTGWSPSITITSP
jgi:hypothetical protein